MKSEFLTWSKHPADFCFPVTLTLAHGALLSHSGCLWDMYPGAIFTASHCSLLHSLPQPTPYSLRQAFPCRPICRFPHFSMLSSSVYFLQGTFHNLQLHTYLFTVSVPLTWPPQPPPPDAKLQEGRKQSCLFSCGWTHSASHTSLLRSEWVSHFFLCVVTEQWESAIPGTKSQTLSSRVTWDKALELQAQRECNILQGSLGNYYVK